MASARVTVFIALFCSLALLTSLIKAADYIPVDRGRTLQPTLPADDRHSLYTLVTNRQPECPYPVQCFQNPCNSNPCPSWTTCQADYCHGGCDFYCVFDNCPNPLNCAKEPCIANPCPAGNICISIHCTACTRFCIKA